MAEASSSSNKWEVSKENVRQSESGHEAKEVGKQFDEKMRAKYIRGLQRKIAYFDSAILVAHGLEKLSLYRQYIDFLSKCLRPDGQANIIIDLCKAAFFELEHDEDVFNTEDWLHLILAYCKYRHNTVNSFSEQKKFTHDVFNVVYLKGMCRRFALFYIRWIEACLRTKSRQIAQIIFNLGFENLKDNPDEKAILEEKYDQFLSDTMIIEAISVNIEPKEESAEPMRQAMTALQQTSDGRVSNNRGFSRADSLKPSKVKGGQYPADELPIHEDDTSCSQAKLSSGSCADTPLAATFVDNKENRQAATVWNAPSAHKRQPPSRERRQSPTSDFTIYEDSSDVMNVDLQVRAGAPRRQLKPKVEEDNLSNSILAFEADSLNRSHEASQSSNNGERFAFNITLLSKLNSEFQFEEVRAIHEEQKLAATLNKCKARRTRVPSITDVSSDNADNNASSTPPQAAMSMSAIADQSIAAGALFGDSIMACEESLYAKHDFSMRRDGEKSIAFGPSMLMESHHQDTTDGFGGPKRLEEVSSMSQIDTKEAVPFEIYADPSQRSMHEDVDGPQRLEEVPSVSQIDTKEAVPFEIYADPSQRSMHEDVDGPQRLEEVPSVSQIDAKEAVPFEVYADPSQRSIHEDVDGSKRIEEPQPSLISEPSPPIVDEDQVKQSTGKASPVCAAAFEQSIEAGRDVADEMETDAISLIESFSSAPKRNAVTPGLRFSDHVSTSHQDVTRPLAIRVEENAGQSQPPRVSASESNVLIVASKATPTNSVTSLRQSSDSSEKKAKMSFRVSEGSDQADGFKVPTAVVTQKRRKSRKSGLVMRSSSSAAEQPPPPPRYSNDPVISACYTGTASFSPSGKPPVHKKRRSSSASKFAAPNNSLFDVSFDPQHVLSSTRRFSTVSPNDMSSINSPNESVANDSKMKSCDESGKATPSPSSFEREVEERGGDLSRLIEAPMRRPTIPPPQPGMQPSIIVELSSDSSNTHCMTSSKTPLSRCPSLAPEREEGDDVTALSNLSLDDVDNSEMDMSVANASRHEINIQNYTMNVSTCADNSLNMTMFNCDDSQLCDRFDDGHVAKIERKLRNLPQVFFLRRHAPEIPKRTPAPLLVNPENETSFQLLTTLGKGSFGKVFEVTISSSETCYAMKHGNRNVLLAELFHSVALKSRLVKTSFDSLKNLSKLVPSFINAYFYDDEAFLVSDVAKKGSLITFINQWNESSKTKPTLRSLTQHGGLPESLCLIFAYQLLMFVREMHKLKMLHLDIKPDNILVRRLPVHLKHFGSFVLADWGQSKDLTTLPSKTTTLGGRTSAKDFDCVEQRTGLPWVYQPDLFGVAGSIHVALFGRYMNIYFERDLWRCTAKFRRSTAPTPSRMLFNSLFERLLNVGEKASTVGQMDWSVYDKEIADIEQVFKQHYAVDYIEERQTMEKYLD